MAEPAYGRLSRETARMLTALAGELRQRLEDSSPTLRPLTELCRHYGQRINRPLAPSELADQAAQSFVMALVACDLYWPPTDAPPPAAQRQLGWLLESADPCWQTLLLAAARVVRPELARAVAGNEIRGEACWQSAAGWLACQPLDLLLTKTRRDLLGAPGAADSAVPTGPESGACGMLGEGLPLAANLYESFLTHYDRRHRRRQGVFYTPPELARFLVARVAARLRAQGIDRGLAAPTLAASPHAPCAPAPLGILDPAAGTGVLLWAAVERIALDWQKSVTAGNASSGNQNPAAPANWSNYVRRQLLPRLYGFELLLPACVLAHLQLADLLRRTGFDFQDSPPLNVFLTDTLAGPEHQWEHRGEDPRYQLRFPVLLANPPFSGISQINGDWIHALLRGRDPASVTSYFHAGGKAINERKHWLNDDYVKFFRYGQWHLEAHRQGVLAYITNHGYLDNVTFRGMRDALAECFPEIEIFDLAGNAKRGDSRRTNQNVFGIEQGIAVGIFQRGDSRGTSHDSRAAEPIPCAPAVSYWSFRGSRAEKLDQLTAIREDPGFPAGGARGNVIASPPGYEFTPRAAGGTREFLGGVKLTELMPLHSTAPVTARDRFLVALEEPELRQRMTEFFDLANSDDEIRARYFRRTRSPKYPAGDTRGWQLAEARRRPALRAHWQAALTTCLYRPFDVRSICWSPQLVDWPRNAVTSQLAAPGNLALIARRQMPPDQPCTYFWITDRVALDGVIRSDNRGSETLFPMLRGFAADGGEQALPGEPQANFSAPAIAAFAAATQLAWDPAAVASPARGFGPVDLMRYLYALFHTPQYRETYAERLRTDFPRIPLPNGQSRFRALARAGARLIDLHLLRATDEAELVWSGSCIGRGEYQGESIVFRRGATVTGTVSGVPQEVWDFRAGAYQVCPKWLTARRAAELKSKDRRTFAKIVRAVQETIELMQWLRIYVNTTGGFRETFHWPAG